VVPSLQKKTGAVAGDAVDAGEEKGEEKPKVNAKKRKVNSTTPKAEEEDEDDAGEEEEEKGKKKARSAKQQKKAEILPVGPDGSGKAKARNEVKAEVKIEESAAVPNGVGAGIEEAGRRRSGRVRR